MSPNPIFGRIWILMFTVFVDMLGFFLVLPLLPFYAEKLGATPVVVGLLVSIFAFAQLASAPLWGRLSDHFGRKPALLAGLAISAASFVLFAYATSLWLLVISRLVQGIGSGTTGVAQAYVSDTVEPKDRAKALGWLSAATSAGVMLGPALGSLASRLGPAAPGLFAAVLCVLNVLCAWRFLPESHSVSARAAHVREPIRRTMATVLSNPLAPASLMILVYSVGMMAFMAMNGILALFLERRFGVDEHSIGWFFIYVGGISLVMRAVLLGPVIARFGEIRVQRIGAFALAAGMATIPLPNTIPTLALAIALVPIGTALLFPATTSLVSRFAPAGQTGQLMGVQQAFGGVCRMVGPMWSGAAFQYLSISAPFWIAAFLMLLVALAAMRLGPSALAE